MASRGVGPPSAICRPKRAIPAAVPPFSIDTCRPYASQPTRPAQRFSDCLRIKQQDAGEVVDGQHFMRQRGRVGQYVIKALHDVRPVAGHNCG